MALGAAPGQTQRGMTEWRSVAQCAPQCDTCRHALVEAQPRVEHLLCREPRVIAAFGRERVAAGLARADVCFARFHPEYRA